MTDTEKALDGLVEAYSGIDDPDGEILDALVQFLKGNKQPLIDLVEAYDYHTTTGVRKH